MSYERGPGVIARNVQTVLQSFRSLADSLTDRDDSTGLRQLSPRFEDETTRFKMWSGNLGAHQSGRASLDYRLREAPHLHQQVIYLLQDVSRSLQDALALIRHEQPSWLKAQASELGGCGSASSEDGLHDVHGSEFSDSDDDEKSPDESLKTLCTDVGEATDCLLRLSVAIANPAPHERVRKLGAGPLDDVSFYEKHDIGYARDKFPKMSLELAQILGKSITRRRQFFKYREAHHAKLAAGLETMALHGGDGFTEIVPKTLASSLPENMKNLSNFDIRADVIDEEGRSEMAMSQTSYATTSGFLAEEKGGQKIQPPPPLKVPPLPAAAKRGSFECPFCYRMVSASNRDAWKRHVFGDLRPYTCLFHGCTESNMDFDRRHRWQVHISKYHWLEWSCPFKCEGAFPSAAALRRHLSSTHLSGVSEEQLSAVVALGENAAPNDIENECPLCLDSLYGLKPYVKHVGRHLEQLALFALPSLEEEGTAAYNESGDQEVAGSQISLHVGETDALQTVEEPLSSSPKLQDVNPHSAEGNIAVEAEETSVTDNGSSDLRQEINDGQTSEIHHDDLKLNIGDAKLAEDDLDAGEAIVCTAADIAASIDEKRLDFTDARGRQLRIPLQICEKWKDMEALILDMFSDDEALLPEVVAGHYDLTGPNGEIILPSVWDQVIAIKPEWPIDMIMRPLATAGTNIPDRQGNSQGAPG